MLVNDRGGMRPVARKTYFVFRRMVVGRVTRAVSIHPSREPSKHRRKPILGTKHLIPVDNFCTMVLFPVEILSPAQIHFYSINRVRVTGLEDLIKDPSIH